VKQPHAALIKHHLGARGTAVIVSILLMVGDSEIFLDAHGPPPLTVLRPQCFVMPRNTVRSLVERADSVSRCERASRFSETKKICAMSRRCDVLVIGSLRATPPPFSIWQSCLEGRARTCCGRSSKSPRYARCGIFGRSPFALPVIGGRGSLVAPGSITNV